MTDYHTTYKGPEGQTTEWDDLQVWVPTPPPPSSRRHIRRAAALSELHDLNRVPAAAFYR